MNTNTAPMATEKQIDFLKRLLAERTLPEKHAEFRTRAMKKILSDDLTRSEASAAIQWVLGHSEEPAADRNRYGLDKLEKKSPCLTPGVYRKNGEVYTVMMNREKTRTYAKKLTKLDAPRLTKSGNMINAHYVYAAGAIYKLSEEDKLTRDEAEALSLQYGICCVCGRELVNGESVRDSIGPVCRKNMGW